MPNQLADATSPYLVQHASNPVDWHPWCEAALDKARRENKPVLLSIGYSACHWCHVMAYESFKDDGIAAQMNRDFVNIKVDREERPDLDRIYQMAHQIITGRPGGWPLTVMLDPATQAPFMAGTYFPSESGLGMPAFPDVLRQVADWYAANGHQLADQKQRLDEILERLTPKPGAVPTAEALSAAGRELENNFDAEHGGFTGAPKFPHPASLNLAHRLAARGNTRAGEMARYTLERMAAAGLFDHLGGGLFRYAVDPRWEIPHFEKMLYDNGTLLCLYARAASGFDHAGLRRTADATADWLLAMRGSEGGFHSSLDADSDGDEGAFYLWRRGQIEPLLGADFELFACAYGMGDRANFGDRWHLRRTRTTDNLAAAFGLAADTVERRLSTARERLAKERARRPAPGRDDKILTAWNALAIEGLANAAAALGRDDCLQAARTALDFIHTRLYRDGRLLAVHAGGRSHTPGFLDDHAFLLQAILAVLALRWHTPDLLWARSLANALLDHFEDTDAGGFHFTADDHEQLLTRPKPLGDESTPSGNGMAAQALLQLGWLLGERRYLAAAERTLAVGADAMQRFPLAHASLLGALDDYLQPPATVIVRAPVNRGPEWTRAARAAEPGARVYTIPPAATGLPDSLADKTAAGSADIAYFCRSITCSAPIHDPAALADAMAN